MRKITLLLSLLLFAGNVVAQVNYNPTNVTQTSKSRSDRNMESVVVAGTTYTLTSSERSTTYNDKYDDVTFTVAPGQEISLNITTNGSWIHGTVYIDFDKNGFTAGVTENWKPTGDLVAYAFYNNGSSSDASGWNSVGTIISGDNRNRPAIPSYTIPTNIAPGEYRIRFQLDWCSIDPNGDADGKFSDFMANGGQILDAKLVVAGEEPTPEGPTEDQMLQLLQKSTNLYHTSTGVGYPKETSTAKVELGNAIAALDADRTAENYNALQTALNNFYACTDVNMPENGKAYTFKNVQKDGTTQYIKFDVTNGITLSAQATDAEVFVCREKDGKYVFLNNAGKFLTHKGNPSTYTGPNSNKGYTDEYDQTANKDLNDFFVTKITPSNVATNGNTDDIAVTDELLFGYVGIATNRNDRNELVYYVFTKSGGFDQANAPFCRHNLTSMLLIEEATYENTPELKAADGIDGVEGLATFSAPFATVVPEGVTAWYVQGDAQSSTTCMTMTEVEGAIPANTGVILTGATGEVTMVPAAAEAVATVNNNWLKHSAGADLDVPAEESAFILGKANGVVGFYRLSDSERTLGMNKAYLSNDALNSASQVVKMNFDGETTAIETVEKVGNVNAPIYDLSGRRVVNAVKGGLYIQNGKKFIVK